MSGMITGTIDVTYILHDTSSYGVITIYGKE